MYYINVCIQETKNISSFIYVIYVSEWRSQFSSNNYQIFLFFIEVLKEYMVTLVATVVILPYL